MILSNQIEQEKPMNNFDDIFEIAETEDPKPVPKESIDFSSFDLDNEEPVAINYDINEKVVAKITKAEQADAVNLPELKDDCVHHFVIPTIGVSAVGMCKKCGGGKVFTNISDSEFNNAN